VKEESPLIIYRVETISEAHKKTAGDDGRGGTVTEDPAAKTL